MSGDAGSVSIRRVSKDGKHGYEVAVTGSTPPPPTRSIARAEAKAGGGGIETPIEAGAGVEAGGVGAQPDNVSKSARGRGGKKAATTNSAGASSSGDGSIGSRAVTFITPALTDTHTPTHSLSLSSTPSLLEPEFYPFSGVDGELEAFGKVVIHALGRSSSSGVVDCNKPEAAIADLEVLAAILESGNKEGTPVVLTK